MERRDLLFWATTGLFCLMMTSGGLANLAGAEFQVKTYEGLGYPLYMMKILGVAKLLGVAAVLAPGLPRLKEWAYAGFTFDMLGAFASHAFAASEFMPTIIPLVVLSVTAASYLTRPESRRWPFPNDGDRHPSATVPAV